MDGARLDPIADPGRPSIAAIRSEMNDQGIQNRIEQLVKEEHELLALDPATRPPDAHERLQAVEVELDRCWDLLRQRRARREFHENPDEASVRDESTVEGYLQ
jgi:hypothetical protein